MLEAGEYRARAAEARLGFTGTGKEQVAVRFELLDFPGQSITSYHFFSSDKAIEISMKGLRAAGFRGSDLSDLSSLSGETPEVILVVEHETYNGKTSAKVKFINAAGGLAMKDALDPAAAKSFAQRMKAKILAFDSSTSAPKPQKMTGSDGPPHPDEPPPGFSEPSDDIPF